MKTILEIILLSFAVIIFLCIFFYSADILLAPSTPQSSDNQVCFSEKCFSVQLAKTNKEKEQGLMYVEKMEENKGMLFIFEKEGVYPFWMKNTLIPLDIIWISKDKKIVFIGKNIQPCKKIICPVVDPAEKAGYVLEVNGGLADKYGVKVGDPAEIKIK